MENDNEKIVRIDGYTEEEFINHVLETYQQKNSDKTFEEVVRVARFVAFGNHQIGSYKAPINWGEKASLSLIEKWIEKNGEPYERFK